MRDLGYDVEDPDEATIGSGVYVSPPGVDQDEFSDAARECATKAGVTSGSNVNKDKWEQDYAAVAECIKSRGYPDFPEQEPGVLDLQNYPRSDEQNFQKTLSDCLTEFSPDTQMSR